MCPAWLRVLLLLLAVLTASAGYGVAAVERYVDEQGTVHITNLGAPPAPVLEPAPPTRPSLRPSPPPEPPALPAPEPLPPESVPPGEPSPEPQSARPERGGLPEVRGTEREETGTLEAEGSLPRPPGTLSPGMPPVGLAAGGASSRGLPVTTYRDAQGTLHITTAPAKLRDDLIRLAGYEWPAHLPRPAAGPPAAEAGTQVAGETPLPPGLAKRLTISAATTPLQPQGARTLRHFRDKRGVVHIVSTRPRPLPATRMVMAAPPPPPPGPVFREAPRPATPPPPNLPASWVVVRRDQGGRVTIVSETPPPRRGWASGSTGPPEALKPLTLEAARTYGLPPSLVEAVIRVESNFSPRAVSPKGAMGLMQLMPGTARDLGVEDPFCPRQNILAGTRYLRLLLNLFQQDLSLALAAYNAGFRRVLEHGWRIPPIPETQEFVSRVLQEYSLRENGLRPPRDAPG